MIILSGLIGLIIGYLVGAGVTGWLSLIAQKAALPKYRVCFRCGIEFNMGVIRAGSSLGKPVMNTYCSKNCANVSPEMLAKVEEDNISIMSDEKLAFIEKQLLQRSRNMGG